MAWRRSLGLVAVLSGLFARHESGLVLAAPARRDMVAWTPIEVSRTLTIGNSSFFVPAEPVASLPGAPLVAEIVPFTVFPSNGNGSLTEETLKQIVGEWEASDDVFDSNFLQGTFRDATLRRARRAGADAFISCVVLQLFWSRVRLLCLPTCLRLRSRSSVTKERKWS